MEIYSVVDADCPQFGWQRMNVISCTVGNIFRQFSELKMLSVNKLASVKSGNLQSHPVIWFLPELQPIYFHHLWFFPLRPRMLQWSPSFRRFVFSPLPASGHFLPIPVSFLRSRFANCRFRRTFRKPSLFRQASTDTFAEPAEKCFGISARLTTLPLFPAWRGRPLGSARGPPWNNLNWVLK